LAQTALKPTTPEQETLLPELDGDRPWYLPRTFDAFRFGPFRWFMGAMIWWNAAMSMQMLVRGYLVYQLTGSFTALGVVGLGSGIPMLTLSPLGGVIADRTSRRLVLQLGQTFSIVNATVVAVLLFADVLVFWHLFAASIAQGVMMALVMPSRQSYLPEVVGMQRLMNAIPLQTAGMNLMQLGAPALGGFMIDWIGAGSVYSVMAVMYAMSVVTLFGVKSMSAEDFEASRAGIGQTRGNASRRGRPSMNGHGDGKRAGTLDQLKGGLGYIVRDRTILAIISLSFIGSLLGMPIRMLLAGYAAEVFGDSGATLGLLQSSMAVGALGGALGLATLRMREHRGLLLGASAVLMGVAMIAFSMTTVFILGAVGLLFVGIGSAGRQATSQILVQEYVEDEYRGRVLSVFMMQFSLMSVGTLFVGLYMEAVGARVAIGSLGVFLIAATLLYLALVPRLRRLA
jgi:MFS family permease